MSHRTKVTQLPALVLALGFLGVFACGGGGGGGGGTGGGGTGDGPPNDPPAPTAPTISGTAAAGAPIIGSVTVKDSSTPAITRVGRIALDGTYTLDVAGLRPPFMLRADGTVGGRGYSLFSAGVEADVNGTINITPFTDLIIANVAHDLAASYFESGDFSVFTAAEIAARTDDLRERLQPLLTAVGLETSVDLLRMSFAADHSGLDAVLDVVNVEVDEETMIATIRNIVTDTTFTSEIESGTLVGDPLDPGDAVTAISALQSIETRLDAFANLYATRLPTESEIEGVHLFDTADFLDDGKDWSLFLWDLLDDMPIGFGCGNASIVSVGEGTMEVSFDFIIDGEVVETETAHFRRDPETGLYLLAGNRRLVDVGIVAHANYHPQDAGQQIFTGYIVQVADPANVFGGNGVAVVHGPGGVNHTFYQTIGYERFTQTVGQDNPAVWLSDTQIGQIPDANALYTFDVGFVGSISPTASYDVVVAKRPARRSELSTSSFIQPVSISPSLSSFSGGTITATWTVPATIRPQWFFVVFDDGGAHHAWLDGRISASGTSGTVVAPAETFTGWSETRHGFSYVGGSDVFGREFESRLAFF